jgi:hypothetical protein
MMTVIFEAIVAVVWRHALQAVWVANARSCSSARRAPHCIAAYAPNMSLCTKRACHFGCVHILGDV